MIPSKLLRQELQKLPETGLWHYTSPTGLMGILKQKELWATNSGYLNDKSDSVLVLTLLKEILKQRSESPGNPLNVQHFLELLYEYIKPRGFAGPGIFFIASLSEERDLLSQWETYCPPSGGYSIGFDSAQLAMAAREQGAWLAKCVYEPKTQLEIINEFIDYYRHLYERYLAIYAQRAPAEELEKNARIKVFLSFLENLRRWAPILKHEGFREEKEWRLIVPSTYHDRLQFRIGAGHIIVPYYAFSLARFWTEKVPREEKAVGIIVSPSSTNHTWHAADLLLGKHGTGGPCFVERSNIPFVPK